MRDYFVFAAMAFATILVAVPTNAFALSTALFVDSYNAGSTPAPGGYIDPATALGSPERLTGEGVFPGVVSPFNSPFLNTELVSIGEGGHLTLQLSNLVTPDASGPELGIFTNATIADVDGDFSNPAATASAAPVSTFGTDSALVEVSEDGLVWTSLGEQLFDIPTSGYTDLTNPFSGTPGAVPANFDQPFTGVLDDFAGLDYFNGSATDVLDVLAGSGGGTWLDISGTGLNEISWIRFSVADDNNVGTSLNFELDAVTIASSALGGLVPEPTSASLLAMALVAVGGLRPNLFYRRG